jgi:hypothetical protein
MTVGALKAMTTAPIASIQTAYRGSYFPVGDVKSAPPASAQNQQMPGEPMTIRPMPGYPYGASPPPAVMAAPYGSQGTAQGSAIQAVPAPYGGPSQGAAIPVQPQGGAARAQVGRPGGALQPAPQPAPPPAARELRRLRCGSSTIVCEAGSTAMCEGRPVACN